MGSVLFEGVEGGERAAELHEASALAQGAEVDGGEAEIGGEVLDRRPGVGVVTGEEQHLTPGLMARVGGDVLPVEGVERLDDARPRQQ